MTTLGSDPNVVTFLVASQANVAVDKKILGSDPIKKPTKVRPHKEKINISEEFINKGSGSSLRCC